jgi:hypothetical protein
LAQSCVADEYMLFEPSPVMKPCANTGCSTPKPAAVPTYIAIASGEKRPLICCTLAPISESACSHEIRTWRSPSFFIGNFRRSGESSSLCCFKPFTQAKPRVVT